MAFVNDFSRILFVLGLARERKRVLGLAIGNLVDPKIDSESLYISILVKQFLT